jgi:hypothetical protein
MRTRNLIKLTLFTIAKTVFAKILNMSFMWYIVLLYVCLFVCELIIKRTIAWEDDYGHWIIKNLGECGHGLLWYSIPAFSQKNWKKPMKNSSQYSNPSLASFLWLVFTLCTLGHRYHLVADVGTALRSLAVSVREIQFRLWYWCESIGCWCTAIVAWPSG